MIAGLLTVIAGLSCVLWGADLVGWTIKSAQFDRDWEGTRIAIMRICGGAMIIAGIAMCANIRW